VSRLRGSGSNAATFAAIGGNLAIAVSKFIAAAVTGSSAILAEGLHFVDSADLEPRVYWRLTDNWLELSVRFVTRERGGREVKDAMTRDVLAALDAARIPIASATFALTELPPVPVSLQPQEEDSHA
jgi:hypothetical protein